MTRRVLLVIALAAVALMLLTGQAFAEEIDPWEKLFGCEGVVPISCPGPVIW